MGICVNCRYPIATLAEEKKSLRSLTEHMDYPPVTESDRILFGRALRRTDEILKYGRGCYSNMCCVCSCLYDTINNNTYFKDVHQRELNKKRDLTDPDYGANIG
jgi:hypothetical protein